MESTFSDDSSESTTQMGDDRDRDAARQSLQFADQAQSGIRRSVHIDSRVAVFTIIAAMICAAAPGLWQAVLRVVCTIIGVGLGAYVARRIDVRSRSYEINILFPFIILLLPAIAAGVNAWLNPHRNALSFGLLIAVSGVVCLGMGLVVSRVVRSVTR